MAGKYQDGRPPVEPNLAKSATNTIGPAQPAVPQPTETTALLPSPHEEKPSNVHYRNISGPRFTVLFLSITFGATLAFFDSTLMASAHPVITSYFNASNAASWLSTVFYLSSTVFQPLYGRVSDTIGRRPVVFFAATMFFVSTAWCGFAGSIGSFIAARAVAGIGAGGVMSMAGILTSDVVKIEYRGIYQSYFNMVRLSSSSHFYSLADFDCVGMGPGQRTWCCLRRISLRSPWMEGCVLRSATISILLRSPDPGLMPARPGAKFGQNPGQDSARSIQDLRHTRRYQCHSHRHLPYSRSQSRGECVYLDTSLRHYESCSLCDSGNFVVLRGAKGTIAHPTFKASIHHSSGQSYVVEFLQWHRHQHCPIQCTVIPPSC